MQSAHNVQWCHGDSVSPYGAGVVLGRVRGWVRMHASRGGGVVVCGRGDGLYGVATVVW